MKRRWRQVRLPPADTPAHRETVWDDVDALEIDVENLRIGFSAATTSKKSSAAADGAESKPKNETCVDPGKQTMVGIMMQVRFNGKAK